MNTEQNTISQNNKRDTETDVKTSSNEVVACHVTIQSVTDEEFEAEVNRLKTNKAPGIDNILNEVSKIGENIR